MRLRPGSASDPAGELTALPTFPISGFKGPLRGGEWRAVGGKFGGGKEDREKEGERRKWEERVGRGKGGIRLSPGRERKGRSWTSPLQIFCGRPCAHTVCIVHSVHVQHQRKEQRRRLVCVFCCVRLFLLSFRIITNERKIQRSLEVAVISLSELISFRAKDSTAGRVVMLNGRRKSAGVTCSCCWLAVELMTSPEVRMEASVAAAGTGGRA